MLKMQSNVFFIQQSTC